MEPKNAEGIELDLDVDFEELEERIAPWCFSWLSGETVSPY